MSVALLGAATAYGQFDGTVQVGARVVPFFVANATYDQQSVEVLPGSRVIMVVSMVMIRTNDPGGYMVVFEPDSAVVKRARIEGLSSPLESTGETVSAVEPLTTVKPAVRELRIEIEVHDTVPAGRRNLPFALSVRPMTP